MVSIINFPGEPFLYELPGGMFVGRRIRLTGTVPDGADHFFVDFQCGPSVEPSDTVAFQLAFMFNERCLARNHYEADLKAWGFREHSGALRLRPGDGFMVDVTCEIPSFIVEINGSKFCEFSHRLGVLAITHMYVQGDVNLATIEVLV